MITFLYGTYGSGKTTTVLQNIQKSVNEGRHTFLIVPEQEALLSERKTLETLPPSVQLDLEVLNFSRLYNRVCREYGGLSYRYVKKPIRHLLMWQNLRELAPLLEEYGTLAASNDALSDMMLRAVGECKASAVTPDELERAAGKLSKDDSLARKLRDLALIYASFDRLVSERYSDSADDLSRLHDILKKHDFFKGADVYFDSFTSFTVAEHKIIGQIFSSAHSVTVTIPLPDPRTCGLYTESIRSSLDRLKRSAEQSGREVCETVLTENRRTDSRELTYLSENLWRLDKPELAFDENDAEGRIVLTSCENPYAEAEAAAAYALELLRGGARPREMVVILRDPAKYRGILEPAFEKNGIPIFVSQKTDLCALAPIKLILSALRIRQYGWRKADVIAHVKTGLCDVSPRSADLFEEYVRTWDISGKRFTDGDWTMNPDGFSDRLTERGRDILAEANAVRKKIAEPLERLFILLEAAETLPDMCRALYAYLSDVRLEDKLAELAARERRRGQTKSAKELDALYGVILSTLADVGEALPDTEVSADELSSLLSTVFSKTEIGTIPTSVDEVTIGSAATLRVGNPKYAFVLGLCEGEFPAAQKEPGLFGDHEKKTLAELGVTLSENTDTRSSDELMYVLRAFSAPSHSLYLFTHAGEIGQKTKTPSLPFLRISKLFPHITPRVYRPTDLSGAIGAPQSAVSHLRALRGTKEGTTLQTALLPYIDGLPERISAESYSPNETLSKEVAERVTGETMNFSFSRFESFVKCPFGYYCTYVLGLRESKKAKFRLQDMGSFVHEILEMLLRFAVTEESDGSFPNAETLRAKAEEIVNDYLDRTLPFDKKASGRLSHLCDRLKKLSLLIVHNLIEEFSHSEFRPAFFELSLNGKDGNPPPMVLTSDDGKTRVSFHGVVDRVDLLKKDGEVYIRVVDYKTGTKDFRLEDLSYGINTQMLLYLYTLCLSQNGNFAEKIGIEDGKAPLPAGVVYLSSNIPVIEAEDYTPEEDIEVLAEQKLNRSGLLLQDETILRAMHDALSPAFLPGVRTAKDGSLGENNRLISAEGFANVFENIRKTVLAIADELKGGRADATPIRYRDLDPCAYCPSRAICRNVSNE